MTTLILYMNKWFDIVERCFYQWLGCFRVKPRTEISSPFFLFLSQPPLVATIATACTMLPFTPAKPPPSQVSLPLPFFFFFFPVVHCMNSRRDAFCSCNSGIQPRFFFGPGLAYSQKLYIKKYFRENLWFSRIFCYGILLNIFIP